MHNVITIFKSDLGHLHRSFWAMVVVAFMLLLPAMYAWVNIYANWDPYGNTGGVKIAVVSNDKDYVADDGTVKNVGNDVVESLKKKTSIGWQFLDSTEQALDGVYDGSYYAAIIIDENFTYNMYNFLTTDMTSPTIRYYVNSKTNAIATKITDTAASTIKSTVSENYLKVIIETIFSKLNGLYQGIESDDPISSLEDVLNNVNNNMASYSNTLAAFTKAGNMLQSDLASMNETIDYAIYTINTSRDHLSNQVQSVESAQGELAQVNQEVDTSLKNISDLLQNTIDAFTGNDLKNIDTINATMQQLEKQYSELITYLETRGGETDTSTADALSALRENLTQLQALRKSLGLTNNFSSDDQAYLNMVQGGETLAGIQSDFNDTVVPAIYKAYVDPNATAILESNTASEATLQSMSEFMLQDVSQKLDTVETSAEAAAAATDPAVAASSTAKAKDAATSAVGELQALSQTYAALSKQVPGLDTATLTAAADQAATQLNSAIIDLSGLQMQNVLNNISGQLTDLLQKIDDLKNDEKIQTLLDFFGLDPDAIGSFLAQPVETVTEAVYPVENYGSGMTPFYSTLAVWVGSVILCAILKAEADSTVVPNPKMWQMFFGRYLTFFVFAQLQGLVIVLGDMFLLGCQCLHPWLFIIAGSVTAFSFSLLIYALTV
jgi:putative membrane protein